MRGAFSHHQIVALPAESPVPRMWRTGFNPPLRHRRTNSASPWLEPVHMITRNMSKSYRDEFGLIRAHKDLRWTKGENKEYLRPSQSNWKAGQASVAISALRAYSLRRLQITPRATRLASRLKLMASGKKRL